MTDLIETIIRHAFNAPVDDIYAVGGGSVNETAGVAVGDARFFVKWNVRAPQDFFAIEAEGLKMLGNLGVVRVPEVVTFHQATADFPAYLILEWLEPSMRRTERFAERLGQAIAQLHRHTHTHFGLDYDNFIGELPQPNTPEADWVTFYREHRLMPQILMAQRNNRMPHKRLHALERLMGYLNDLIATDEVPTLVHGDLWSGNFLVIGGDEPVLVDPAVYYGHREMDLAMTELFGGFSPRFYGAYHEAFPIQPNYEQRRPIYQLYPLLVHLNLFGESYGQQIDAICQRFVG